jgi:hypothetical protein
MELLVVPEVRFHDPRVDVVFPDRTELRRTCLTPGIVYGASAEGETGVYEGFVDVDDPESIIKD